MPGCDNGVDPPEYSEKLTDERLEVAQIEIAPSRIHFRAGREQVELALTPNTQLFAPNATVLRDGQVLSLADAQVEIPYRGSVVGDDSSWVRVRVTGDSFEGLIFTDLQLWEIRADGTGKTWMELSDIGDYLDNPSYGHHQCATTEAEAAHATYVAADGAAATHGCEQISIALLADYTHVEALGGVKESEDEMIARLNEADGIFRSDLNYGFSVQSVRTFAEPGGPAFNHAGTDATPLTKFADYKQSELPELGLAHLFVARTMSGAVGKAYVGSTCSSRYGSGVSNYLGPRSHSTIVVTHEIGHNFGSGHDAAGGAYVMAPAVNAAATEFSPISEEKIISHVGSVACFEPCATSKPARAPASPSCSDACGGESATGCWCDQQCTEIGDCCEDYEAVCEQ